VEDIYVVYIYEENISNYISVTYLMYYTDDKLFKKIILLIKLVTYNFILI